MNDNLIIGNMNLSNAVAAVAAFLVSSRIVQILNYMQIHTQIDIHTQT